MSIHNVNEIFIIVEMTIDAVFYVVCATFVNLLN